MAQIAVSVVLLAGAGLLTRTMMQLSRGEHRPQDRGSAHDATCRCSTPTELLADPAADAAAKVRYERMRREIAALPGVIDVGLGSTDAASQLGDSASR